MSTPFSALKWPPSLVVLALSSLTLVPSCHTVGTSSSPPARRPLGHETAWWDAGMANLKLDRRARTLVKADGSCVHVIKCSGPVPAIYIWDRISQDDSTPAVATASPDFNTYATLDHRNRVFAGSLYRQLRIIWKEGTTPSEMNLLRKLRDEVDEGSKG